MWLIGDYAHPESVLNSVETEEEIIENLRLKESQIPKVKGQAFI